MATDTHTAHAAIFVLQQLQLSPVEVYDGADGTGSRTVAHEDPGCTNTTGFGAYKDKLCTHCVHQDPNLDGAWHRWFRVRSEIKWSTSIVASVEAAEAALDEDRTAPAIATKRFHDLTKGYQAVLDPAWVRPPAGAPSDPPQLTAALEAWGPAATAVRDLMLEVAASGQAFELYARARALDSTAQTNHPQLVAVTGNFPSLQSLVLAGLPTRAATVDGRRCTEVGYDTWCALLDEDEPVAELISHATVNRAAAHDLRVLEMALTAYDPDGACFADVHAAVAAAHR